MRREKKKTRTRGWLKYKSITPGSLYPKELESKTRMCFQKPESIVYRCDLVVVRGESSEPENEKPLNCKNMWDHELSSKQIGRFMRFGRAREGSTGGNRKVRRTQPSHFSDTKGRAATPPRPRAFVSHRGHLSANAYPCGQG